MVKKKVSLFFYVLFLLVFFNNSCIAITKDAKIIIDTDKMSEWTIDRLLFGRFYEHHGGAVYPGIYEQYIVNTSFEKYYFKDSNSPTPLRDINPWLIFEDTRPFKGVSYPWEPFGSRKNVLFGLCGDAFNSQASQQVTILSSKKIEYVGVKQKLALPDYRIGKYKLRFFAKSDCNNVGIDVRLADHGSQKVIASQKFALSNKWQVFNCILDIKDFKASSQHCNRYGIYDLIICGKDKGSIFLDEATLFPTDVVEGRWNSETIKHLKDTGVTTIRWPGGNFASGYHWMDGIGDIDKRPTRKSLAWEGLENNHVGTDEFLRFCELADLTPLICVGFDTACPEEAANWVEYCNGSIETKYGKLRAENGHPEPWNVKLWQVGNEVYGDYQIGHANAKDYATKYIDYYKAMKAADSNIMMMVMGKDPGYQEDDDNAWNKTLFSIAGEKMDYVDIHRYVRGIRKWKEFKQWDLTHLNEIHLSYNTQYDVVIDSIQEVALERNLNVKLAVTEWAQYLSIQSPKVPHAFSQGNGVFYAGMMNSFIRNGDFVKISCSHDFSIFVNNKAPWSIPPLPRNHIAKMYSQINADRLLDINVDCDKFDIPRKIPQMIIINDIPYIDAVAVSDKDKRQIVIFAINRSLTSIYNTCIELKNISISRIANIERFIASGDPMAGQMWGTAKAFEIQTEEIPINKDGKFNINMPVCSVTKITIN